MIKTLKNSRLLGCGLICLAIAHLLFQLFSFAPGVLARTDRDRDVVVYYEAARAVRESRPLYRLQTNYGPDRSPEAVYIYPPPLAVLLSPLATFSFVAFARLWFVLQLCALWIYAFTLARLSGNQAGESRFVWRFVLIWGMIVACWPGGYRALALGQIDPVLWMFCGLGLLCWMRSTLWSGAAIVKVFYAWPLIIQIVHLRRATIEKFWRTFAPVLVLLLVLGIASSATVGVAAFVFWAREVLPTLSQGNFNADNVSLSMGVLRLARFCGWHYIGGPLPATAHFWLSIAALAGPGLTWFFLRRQSFEMQCSAVIAVAALCAPVCWTSYLPITLLPLACWIGVQNYASRETQS